MDRVGGCWPDFVIIGAAKAGTTALFRAVAGHPGVCASDPKEPRYFAYAGSRPRFPCPGGDASAESVVHEESAYRKLFAHRAPGQAAGEASTAYLAHPDAPANAHTRIPDARLIVILRHPVERAFSQWLHMRHKGLEELDDFEAALAAESSRAEQGWRLGWLYQSGGRYGSQLSRWLEFYPRERILLLFYEDWKAHPQETLKRVFEHIGLAAPARSTVARENVTSMQPRWKALHYALVNERPAHRWARKVLPRWARESIHRGINRWNLEPGPRLDPALRDALARGYADEIEIVESLTGRNLSHWKGAA